MTTLPRIWIRTSERLPDDGVRVAWLEPDRGIVEGYRFGPAGLRGLWVISGEEPVYCRPPKCWRFAGE